MSKRRKAARAAKAKRQQAARRADWWRHWPYFAVGGVAVALVAALFLVSTGGEPSSSEVQASYPVGYTPPTDGDESAPVEFVMWADYQCPFCGRFEAQTLPELRQRYVDTGKMKFVWRNFENYGSESQDSAVAAHCAGEQDKFWEFKDVVYQNQQGIQAGVFTEDNLRLYAIDLGLDIAAYEDCFTNNGAFYLAAMRADKAMAQSQGVNGTPAFFINGKLVSGAQPTSTFEAFITNALAEARQ